MRDSTPKDLPGQAVIGLPDGVLPLWQGIFMVSQVAMAAERMLAQVKATAFLIVTLLLLLAIPAIADEAERIGRIRERAILAADVLRVARLAEACGRRDATWAGRVRAMVIARQEVDAARYGDEVEGGRKAVRWLMLGARLVADAAADAEYDRYGEVACAELDETGDVTGADRLLAAEGR